MDSKDRDKKDKKVIEEFDFNKAIVKPLKDGGNKMTENMLRDYNNMVEKLKETAFKINDSAKERAKQANKKQMHFLNNLKKPFKDIEKSIKQFGDYFVKFFETINPRFQNLFSGVEVIFNDGLLGEVQTIGDSMISGFNGIGYLFAATGEIIKNYLVCGVKFLKNIYFCIFFYIIQVVLYILYLPVWLTMWVLKTFIGVDLFWIEERTWNGLEIVDGFLWHWFGFHIIYWPKNVRERCFVCIRLKKKVLKNTAKAVDYNFNERIRKASGLKMKWAERVSKAHMNEFISWPDVKHPKQVRRSIPKYKLPPKKYRF